LPGIPALFAEQVDPGDELWAFGYPTGQYHGGEPVIYRYEGISQAADGTVLLRATQGTAWPGHSGSPVLSWRTGAVCGVVRLGSQDSAPRVRLIPFRDIVAAFPWLAVRPPWARHHREWLDLLDDDQLHAASFRYAGPRLRAYLHAARATAREHPYLLTQSAPPLSKVYLRQQAARQPDRQESPGNDAEPQESGTSLVEADSLLEHHRGAQVIGGPGAGKSSLLRYITDVTANRWLDGQDADYVPVCVPADALCESRTLPQALAKAVVTEAGAKVTDLELAGLFAEEPVAGVPWLVLVDGVDEILDPQLRHVALGAIAYHRQRSSEYRFIVTSRPLPDAALGRLSTGDTPAYDIERFAYSQLQQFALGWFNALSLPEADEAVVRFTAQLERSRLQQLARIPLIAAMMCVVFADDPTRTLPLGRAELYEKFVRRLLDKHRWPLDARRRLQDRVRPYGIATAQAADKLVDDLRHLLEELADYRQGGGGTLSGHAVELKRSELPSGFPPAEWEELIWEVLRQSGVLVERSGDFTFVHQSIQEYLAACHSATQYADPSKRRSRWLPHAWQTWPWPDAEVKVFLAEIFIDHDMDISRPLARLMRRRNRAQNAPFIAELDAHGTRLPQRIRDRAVAALIATVTAPSTVIRNEWLTAVDYLISLDSAKAIATLSKIVTGETARGPRRRVYRQLEAAQIVLRLDPGHGLRLLEGLVNDKSANSSDRLRAARVVAEQDPSRGMACLIALIEDPSIDQHGYLEGARALGELDRGQALIILGRSAADRRTAIEDRIRIVQTIGELDYAHDMLEKLSRDITQDDSLRIMAAETLHRNHRERGEQALAAIAVDRHLETSTRVHLLEKLEDLKYPRAAQVRAQLQADGTIADHNRRMEEIRRAKEAEKRREEARKRQIEEAQRRREEAQRLKEEKARKRQLAAQKRMVEEQRKQQLQTQKRREEEARKQQLQAQRRREEEARKQRLEAQRRKAAKTRGRQQIGATKRRPPKKK
jgi:hypothetical protein